MRQRGGWEKENERRKTKPRGVKIRERWGGGTSGSKTTIHVFETGGKKV